ncbi:MAG: hypothetical protein ACI814_001819 [Mariniblastus sp.]|jgi:hypothetical protein
MSNSIVSQVPKNLLFRYRMPCRRFEGKPNSKFELSLDYQLPNLGAFESQVHFADIRTGWNEEGLYLWAEITGKEQSLWCRETQLLDSDGIQVWIDTRDTHNVHRASKFCHWYLLMPSGGGDKNENPMASMLKINRSKDDSPTINRFKLDVRAKISKTGYKLSCFIPGKALNGWDTTEHRSIGFNFAVVDRELGWQTLAIGPELPIMEDPSLWQSLQLVD